MIFRIKYGTLSDNIDITRVCFEKCVKNNVLFIPKGGDDRNMLFTDPFHGVLKNIIIMINENVLEYDSSVDVRYEKISDYIFLHPITFSVPEEKIVTNVCHKKTKMISSLVPGDMKTYIYKNEKDYYEEYQVSMFATTFKKGGWDCMRHYEIVANGSIPYFPDIENCPPKTMALLPKEDIIRGNKLYQKYKDKKVDELTGPEKQECIQLIDYFLDYFRKNLTTTKIAEYILNVTNFNNASKILFFTGRTDPDYLRCLTLHGFKKLLGRNVHDYPKIEHIYKSNMDFRSLYGGGITYSNLLDNNLHDDYLDTTVEDDIINNRYDIIIYGSYHRGMPFYDLIQKHYSSDKIILVCGEDCHYCDYWNFVEKGHHVFVREL